METLTSQSRANPGLGSCPLKRDKLVSSFCEIIPSTVPALDAVMGKTMAAVKDMACAPEEEKLGDVELALREAMANAILHGNEGRPNKRVIIACFCECEGPGNLLLVVRDEGLGFDPTKVPDPTTAQAIYSAHGRGVFLMRQLMDDVRHKAGGCEVELRKRGETPCAPARSASPERDTGRKL